MPAMSALERAFCRSGSWTAFTSRMILPWALQGLRPAGELLELGAGSGGLAVATRTRFPGLRVTATDIDPTMVESARQRVRSRSDVRFKQADVTQLPYGDESFDYVASYLMLDHVIDWHRAGPRARSRALSEVTRVLRPGGAFVGYDLTDTRLARWIHWADRSPDRLLSIRELEGGLTKVGLTTITVHRGLGGHVMRFLAVKPWG